MKGRICLLIFSCLITEPLSLFATGYLGIGEGCWEVYVWFELLKEKSPILTFKLRFIQEILLKKHFGYFRVFKHKTQSPKVWVHNPVVEQCVLQQ